MGLIIETAGCHMVHPASVYEGFFRTLVYKSIDFADFKNEFEEDQITVRTAEKTVVLLKKYKSKLKLSEKMHVQMCESWIKMCEACIKNNTKITIQ